MQGLGNVSRGLGELLPGALDASPHVSLSLYDSLENSTMPPYTHACTLQRLLFFPWAPSLPSSPPLELWPEFPAPHSFSELFIFLFRNNVGCFGMFNSLVGNMLCISFHFLVLSFQTASGFNISHWLLGSGPASDCCRPWPHDVL